MSVFSAEHISMDVLVEMTHDSLKDIGVGAYGHRHKILRGIKDLQARIPERKKHKTNGKLYSALIGGSYQLFEVLFVLSLSSESS